MDTRKADNTSKVERRRKYTDKFKRDAVSRVLRTGKSCTRVGEELGVNPNMLARWRREQIGDEEGCREIAVWPIFNQEAVRSAAGGRVSEKRENSFLL